MSICLDVEVSLMVVGMIFIPGCRGMYLITYPSLGL